MLLLVILRNCAPDSLEKTKWTNSVKLVLVYRICIHPFESAKCIYCNNSCYTYAILSFLFIGHLLIEINYFVWNFLWINLIKELLLLLFIVNYKCDCIWGGGECYTLWENPEMSPLCPLQCHMQITWAFYGNLRVFIIILLRHNGALIS